MLCNRRWQKHTEALCQLYLCPQKSMLPLNLLSRQDDQPWPAMTSLFTALVLVFDCAGLEGTDGCDDEDGSCSGLNFNSFNSTLSLLSSEERLEGVATTPQTPQTHTDSYRLHTTCAPYSWLSSFSWAIGVIWVSYLGPSSAKFSSPYRSSASFIKPWVNFWGNSLWTHSDTMNIYKCTTWLGTHLLFCADSTAGLISCRRDFGRSKMHTTLHLTFILESCESCIPRCICHAFPKTKSISSKKSVAACRSLSSTTWYAIRWNYSRSTRIAVDSRAKPMACCQYAATEARSRILRHFSLSLASMSAACENK